MRALRTLIGYGLLIAGAAGLVFCAAGLVLGAQALDRAQAQAAATVEEADRALGATADGLAVADTSLARADTTVGTLRTTVGSISQTITDTLPAMETLRGVVGEEVPATIRTTRQTLDSARETARVADSILGAVSSLGLLSTGAYNPKVPLSAAIGQVSDSLSPLPDALERVHGDLGTAQENLRRFQTDTGAMAASVGEIQGSVGEARAIVERYQKIVADLRADVARVRGELPGWFAAARVGGALLVFWLGAAQLGLITQGLELTRAHRRARRGRAAAPLRDEAAGG